MKKIITAIGNEILNRKLNEEKNLEIIGEDIQYKEGILEFLEKEKNIDFLILSELLPGQIDIKELIEKIKIINPYIQIILFLEKENKELENYLYAKGIYFIFYNNQINYFEIIKLINNEEENLNKKLKIELDELKKILLENKNNKKINIFNKIKNKSEKNINKNNLLNINFKN